MRNNRKGEVYCIYFMFTLTFLSTFAIMYSLPCAAILDCIDVLLMSDSCSITRTALEIWLLVPTI